jgi:hypothetical protein
MSPSLEKDFLALELRRDNISSELQMFESMCNDAISTKCKRQKIMEEEFKQWETAQREIIMKKKKEEECRVF